MIYTRKYTAHNCRLQSVANRGPTPIQTLAVGTLSVYQLSGTVVGLNGAVHAHGHNRTEPMSMAYPKYVKADMNINHLQTKKIIQIKLLTT